MDYQKKYIKYKSKYLSLKDSLKQKNLTKNSQLKFLQNGGNMTEIILFKASWCPHCTNFLPTWKRIQQSLKGKYQFTTYDSDLNKDIIKQWEVEGYPTIMIKKGSKTEEYKGSRDYDALFNHISNLN